MRLLTLLSDFGSASSYPAQMKAVIAAQVAVQFLDITHDVPRHDVRQGAFLLASVVRRCPAGTVHLAVVDPGVGTDRRALVVSAGGQVFVGPDNGLLMPAARSLGRVHAYALSVGMAVSAPSHMPISAPFHMPISATFHGRDVFAPAAARLLEGVAPARLGRPIEDPVELTFGPPAWIDGVLVGEVLYVDPFGNVVTNIAAREIPLDAHLRLQTGRPSETIRTRATYGAGRPGELLLIPGSEGLLEIAVREGSAAVLTGLAPGDPVRLRPEPSGRS